MWGSEKCLKAVGQAAMLTLMLQLSPAAWSQFAAPKPKTAEVTQEPSPDPLGRNTPRGGDHKFSQRRP